MLRKFPFFVLPKQPTMARIISSYGFALLALATILPTQAIASDTYGPAKGTTSRYWDCCKPSCGWADKGKFVNSIPVGTCDAKGNPLTDFNAGTGCNGGDSRPCANNVPWAVNDTFSYGFAGVHTLGGEESTWCCACYELTFTTGPAKGKKMVIQSTNTDYEDDTVNRFTFGVSWLDLYFNSLDDESDMLMIDSRRQYNRRGWCWMPFAIWYYCRQR